MEVLVVKPSPVDQLCLGGRGLGQLQHTCALEHGDKVWGSIAAATPFGMVQVRTTCRSSAGRMAPSGALGLPRLISEILGCEPVASWCAHQVE